MRAAKGQSARADPEWIGGMAGPNRDTGGHGRLDGRSAFSGVVGSVNPADTWRWGRMIDKLVRGGLVAMLFAGGVVAVATPAEAATATKYKNCTALQKKYPHGVGRKGAKDKVRGSTKPVTTFKVDTKVYNANKSKLDRDKDGIACEKR
jgi:Excalibur calcium-binding domain